METIRNYGVKRSADTQAYLQRAREDCAHATDKLPRSWRQMEEGNDAGALWYTRGNVLDLLSCEYAFGNRLGFRAAAELDIQYSPARAVSRSPESWELEVDLAIGFAKRDRDFLRLVVDVAARSTDARGFVIPESFCNRALAHLDALRPDAAKVEIEALAQRCNEKAFDRDEVAVFLPWCDIARAVLKGDQAAMLPGIEAMAKTLRDYSDREIAGWVRGKPNVELAPTHYLALSAVSLLIIAESAGLSVYDQDNPAFAFCDYRWIQSLWA